MAVLGQQVTCNVGLEMHTGDDLHRLLRWRTAMEADLAGTGSEDTTINNIPADTNTQPGDVSVLDEASEIGNSRGDVVELAEINRQAALKGHISQISEVLTAADPSTLNIDQRRAYEIIVWHLEQNTCWKRSSSSADDHSW